jgi:hypothetical protein
MLPGNIAKSRMRLGEDFEFSRGPIYSGISATSHIACITKIQGAAVLRLFQSGGTPVAQRSHIHQSRYAHIHDFHFETSCFVHRRAPRSSLNPMLVK